MNLRFRQGKRVGVLRCSIILSSDSCFSVVLPLDSSVFQAVRPTSSECVKPSESRVSWRLSCNTPLPVLLHECEYCYRYACGMGHVLLIPTWSSHSHVVPSFVPHSLVSNCSRSSVFGLYLYFALSPCFRSVGPALLLYVFPILLPIFLFRSPSLSVSVSFPLSCSS